ncbi:hypothetical protein PSTH1771_16195 [Pseudomonas syringae pv. theae]|uniref:hypothetical protein n=1 Tax=Pseudomonas syringae TaxID=317 RepID=UPI0023BDBF8E|nr:hypothetical protein [Pseudomonas syringae]GKS06577.1 hypothetical protein PSTH1771_16195 [Pseudomonas syringae pv. theae]
MLPPGKYIPLESAIASLKRDHPEVLKAIAKAISSVDPRAEFNREIITGSKYGDSIPGFAITYGQLGAYLNTAVTRLVSVLIETEVGVIESSHVAVNREWLLNQREHAAHQPEVVREIELRSYASHGATVTPIIQPLEDQDPKAARAELRKLNVRIERSLVIRPDDERDAEMERLRIHLEASSAREKALAAKNDASDKAIKILTRENDQLRKERSSTQLPPASIATRKPDVKPRKLSNVEMRNEKARACQAQVKERAMSLWRHDDYAKHRTMDMVNVIRRLADSEPEWDLPKNDAALARWISSSAPEFAKRPGRPCKEK